MRPHLWGFNELYLSSGNSMMVWNFPWSAAGPSPTSMYLFSVTIGELTWACVLAWASSNVSSLVDGEETSRDLGLDREALERKKNHQDSTLFCVNMANKNINMCECVYVYLLTCLSIYLPVLFQIFLSFLNGKNNQSSWKVRSSRWHARLLATHTFRIFKSLNSFLSYGLVLLLFLVGRDFSAAAPTTPLHTPPGSNTVHFSVSHGLRPQTGSTYH